MWPSLSRLGALLPILGSKLAPRDSGHFAVKDFVAAVNPTAVNGDYMSFVEFTAMLPMNSTTPVFCYGWAETDDFTIQSMMEQPCQDNANVSFSFLAVKDYGFNLNVYCRHDGGGLSGSKFIEMYTIYWAESSGKTLQYYGGTPTFDMEEFPLTV